MDYEACADKAELREAALKAVRTGAATLRTDATTLEENSPSAPISRGTHASVALELDSRPADKKKAAKISSAIEVSDHRRAPFSSRTRVARVPSREVDIHVEGSFIKTCDRGNVLLAASVTFVFVGILALTLAGTGVLAVAHSAMTSDASSRTAQSNREPLASPSLPPSSPPGPTSHVRICQMSRRSKLVCAWASQKDLRVVGKQRRFALQDGHGGVPLECEGALPQHLR